MATEGNKILKKLTIRDMVGGKPAILAAAQMGRADGTDDKGKACKVGSEGKEVPILRVVGQVNGFKAGESDNGSYVELKGTFQGLNLITGEVVNNVARCILPNAISEPLAAALANGSTESADFAVEISVAYQESAAVMYVFSARSLMKSAPAAPVQDILARLEASGVRMTAPLALAAPTLSDADRKAQETAGKAADAAKAQKEAKGKTPAKV